MATITSFDKWHLQPAIEINGQSVQAEETWLLILNERASNIAANVLIRSLSAGNIYGWPVIGVGSHSDDSTLVAFNYNIDRDEAAGYKFLVSLFYTNDIDLISHSKKPEDGESSYDYEEVTVTEEVDVDPITEEIIAASNGEAYWPRLTRERTLDRIIITRNEQRFKPSDKKIYRNKINSIPLTIDGYVYEKRSLRMLSITGKRNTDPEGEIYYIVRYILLYDPDGLHKKVLLDVGTGPSLTGKLPFVNGTRSYKPAKLNGEGEYYGKADQRDTSVFSTNTYNIYDEVSMNPLRL
jgi:hypothetical protein